MDARSRAALLERLRHDAERLAARFGLSYRKLEAERAGVNGHYGICYSDGTIRIRLQHATTGRPLKYSSLVSTLCHELAHLRHFHHGPRFQRFYDQVLEFARDEGIYRPGLPQQPAPARAGAPEAAARPSSAGRDVPVGSDPERPEQLPLFG